MLLQHPRRELEMCLEFKEFCTRDTNLRVIKHKYIVNSTQWNLLAHSDRGWEDQEGEPAKKNEKKEANKGGENQETVGCKSPEKRISREEVVGNVDCC